MAAVTKQRAANYTRNAHLSQSIDVNRTRIKSGVGDLQNKTNIHFVESRITEDAMKEFESASFFGNTVTDSMHSVRKS